MYVGRFALGQFVPLFAACRDGNGDAVSPTSAPTFTVYKSTDTPISGADTVPMPPLAKDDQTGLFLYHLRLGSSFSTGRYHVLIEYAYSGGTGAIQRVFEVIGGGHSSGAYLAIHQYRRPHASYLVGQLDSGTLEFRRL